MLLGDLLAALLVLPTALGQQIYLTPRAAIGRVKIIENVVDMIFVEGSKGRKLVESLLKRAKNLIGKRHELIHNAWGTAKEYSKRSEAPVTSVLADGAGRSDLFRGT
jgi:hypothetical protein